VSRPFLIAERFRGFLPIVVDVETGGFNAKTDALLEIAAVFIDPNEDGTLKDDIRIGEYKRPWNAKKGSKNISGIIPDSELWAHMPEGIDQIGCVYTAQGFEFDYIGVIFGQDLKYNLDSQEWEGHPENSFDKSIRKKPNFEEYAKNIYRILFSRGMEGCYVYFQDKETERFFKSRMKQIDQSKSGFL
jgi:hypothetical protein